MSDQGQLDVTAVRLDDVIATEELTRRTSRRPDYEAEARALAGLGEALEGDPGAILQKLADTALALCRADSAGVSILEPGSDHTVFRWRAIAGTLASHVGGSMSREASPCGVVIQRDATTLFVHPERYFPSAVATDLPLAEALVVPIHAGGRPIGTVWVIAHTPDRKFDAEDARQLTSLSRLAAIAHQAHATNEELRSREGRGAFRLEVSDALRALADPADIQATAMRLLARHLRADRAFFYEIDEDGWATTLHGYKAPNAPPVPHRMTVAGFGQAVLDAFAANAPLVVGDVSTDARFPDEERRAWLSAGASAAIGLPLNKDGRLCAALAVDCAAPRAWTAEDVRIVEEVAERTWAAVERARAEAALRESEKEYRDLCAAAERRAAELHAVLDSIPDAVYLGTQEGITLANQPALDQIGFETLEELNRDVGTLAAELQPRDWRTGVPIPAGEQPFARALRGERVVQDVRLRRRGDGEERVVRSAAAPVVIDGEVIAAVAVATDVTEQKRAEVALRVSEARSARELEDAKRLQEISSQLINEEDVEALYGQILGAAIDLMRADMGSLQVLDPERQELRLIAWKGFHPDSAAFWKTVDTESAAVCGRALGTRARVVVPDVREAAFLQQPECIKHFRLSGIAAVQSTPLIARNGRMVGMISTHWREPHVPGERELTMFDVLARQAADMLERRRVTEQLRDADRRKDEFLAMLGHELRNPLAPLRGVIETLQRQDLAGEGLDRAHAMMERQVEHLTRLVDDLLDMSRISRGLVEPRKELVNLAEVAEQAAEMVRPAVEGQGHDLNVSLPQKPLRVDGDPTRLTQSVFNLLNNAAKYTEPGGKIWLTVEREDDQAVVRVRDNGSGIKPELVPRVFDLFTQGERSLDRSQGGLGLGLTLVKRLVEMHGGTVEAHSEGPGQGSEFVLRLPARPAEEAKPAPPRPPVVIPDAPYVDRALVVDDNFDAAEAMTWALKGLAREVRMVQSGQAAVDLAPEFQPDVIVCDIGMPRMDGYETCRQLRRLPGIEKTFIAAVSGYGLPEDRKRSQEAGFDRHLVKPVGRAALVELVANSARRA